MTSTTANELSSSFSGEQIATLLRTSGPIVHCVKLHAKQTSSNACTVDDKNDDDDRKPAAASTPTPTSTDDSNHSNNDNHQNEGDKPQSSSKRIILENHITQIMVDTTPKKSMVSQILGGPFTFLGQYESEGIVLMVRRQPDTTVTINEDNSQDNKNDENDDNLKREIDGLVLNPHQLQPPLHNAKVYGDILIMRVAPSSTDDDDNDDGDKDGNENDNGTTKKEEKPIELLSNEEFFQNYTKDEYIQFASRTDIEPLPPHSLEDVEEENENDDNDENNEKEDDDDDDDEDDDEEEDEDDEEFVLGDGSDEEDFENDEEAQIGMMNLLLAQIIKKFREENGRGPNTEELLAIKSEVGKQLGIDESILGGASTIDDDDDEENEDDDEEEGGGGNNDEDHDDDTDETKKISSATADESSTTSTEQNGNSSRTQDDNEYSNNKKNQTETKTSTSKKRKSEESDTLGMIASAKTKAKKVKFTNKDHIKLIPAIVKEDNDDDVDAVYEEVEDEEEGDTIMGIRRGANVEEGILEEGEEEI